MKYFVFEDLMYSEIATKHGIENLPPRCDRAMIYFNIICLIDNVLDPIRERFATPMVITSGYRCQRLNELVGGVGNSQHKNGEAADFYFKGFNKKEMAAAFFEIAEEFNFDQLIYYKKKGIIHISYSREENRHQIFMR